MASTITFSTTVFPTMPPGLSAEAAAATVAVGGAGFSCVVVAQADSHVMRAIPIRAAYISFIPLPPVGVLDLFSIPAAACHETCRGRWQSSHRRRRGRYRYGSCAGRTLFSVLLSTTCFLQEYRY